MVMYKIDRRGGVQKSYTRTDPIYNTLPRLILEWEKKQCCTTSNCLKF